MAFYTRTHEEHWLRDKLEEGRILILKMNPYGRSSSIGSGDH